MKTMKKLIIFGAGQQGRNCKRLAPLCGYETAYFVDDIVTGNVEGIPVINTHELVDSIALHDYEYIVAVGDLSVRRVFLVLFDLYRLKGANLIDPTADIEEGAEIGEGNYIYKFVSVYASAKIGNHNIINTKAVIATDACIGDNCNICMGANVCGDCHVGDNSYVGYNATIMSGCNVGERCHVEPCSFVCSNIENGKTVGGVPAEEIGG